MVPGFLLSIWWFLANGKCVASLFHLDIFNFEKSFWPLLQMISQTIQNASTQKERSIIILCLKWISAVFPLSLMFSKVFSFKPLKFPSSTQIDSFHFHTIQRADSCWWDLKCVTAGNHCEFFFKDSFNLCGQPKKQHNSTGNYSSKTVHFTCTLSKEDMSGVCCKTYHHKAKGSGWVLYGC